MDKNSYLSKKRFLITQPMIRSFCGSTMVTLELAEYLSSVGAEVTVYTNIKLPPAISSFEKAGIKVVSSQEDGNLSLKDFDYIWVHSLTMPQQILEELKHLPKKLPAFIFLHMSPLETIPDEHPWIYELENDLSTISLYISEKTLESNKKYGLPPKTGLFRNPAPLKFRLLADRKISQDLRKILIVSNHPPEEVTKAKNILEKAGVDVTIYGDRQDKYDSLSPEILKEYDAVITIGKTVQYAIVGSMPVYIYDWFGGPGWLTKSNYELAKINNFSGRAFVKKTGKEIADEIINGYEDAVKYHLSFRDEDKEEFMIDSALDKVLRNLKPRKIKKFKSEYIESVKAANKCAEIRFVASEELGRAYEYCDDLIRQKQDLKKQIETLKNEKKFFEDFYNSKRIKVLNKILSPHDKIKGRFKK